MKLWFASRKNRERFGVQSTEKVPAFTLFNLNVINTILLPYLSPNAHINTLSTLRTWNKKPQFVQKKSARQTFRDTATDFTLLDEVTNVGLTAIGMQRDIWAT